MRHFIETHFGFVLLTACVVGLMTPALANLPDYSASITLALLTYSSCFKLKDGGFREINWTNIITFYISRYVILPVILFFTTNSLFPSYAAGVFLLALLPTAVSSPAFSHMFGGRVSPSFAIVIISTLLAPLLIPILCSWLLSNKVVPSPEPLFRTLAFCVFIPIVIYIFTRKHKQLEVTIYNNIKLISIILVFFIIAFVVSKQRDFILADTTDLLTPLLLTFSCFFIFLIFGWMFTKNQNRETRISITTCSMFNNVALGVSIALLHFPQDVILFVAIGEAVWATLPIIFRWFLNSGTDKKAES